MSKVHILTTIKNGTEYKQKIFKTKKALFSYAKIWGDLELITNVGKNRFYKDMDSMPGGYEWTKVVHYDGITDEDLAFNGLTKSDITNPTELYGGMDTYYFSASTKIVS